MAAHKATIHKLEGLIDKPELLDQLRDAVAELEVKMKASIPINRNTVTGSQTVGYGVSKAQRGIAADSVISIARAIKALRGW